MARLALGLAALAAFSIGVDARARVDPVRAGQTAVFALLADGRLVRIPFEGSGSTLTLRVGRLPRSPTAGHFLAGDQTTDTLFVLPRPGAAAVVAVDMTTGRIRRSYVVPAGTTYRSLALGPVSRRLYLFGARRERRTRARYDVVLTVLDPRTHATRTYVVRRFTGPPWNVYQGAVAVDEQTVFVSYHGFGTGVDWLRFTRHGLRRCRGGSSQVACLRSHGGIEPYGHNLLATRGDPQILEFAAGGALIRRFDTRLGRNHLMEFAVDSADSKLYAIGSCGYAGGLSIVGLTGGAASLVSYPAPAPPAPGALRPGICGERIALGPRRLLAVAKTRRPLPDPHAGGTVLLLEAARVVREVPTPAEPVDVIFTST